MQSDKLRLVELLLELGRVLLDLLRFFEGLGELAEVGESEASHAGGSCWLQAKGWRPIRGGLGPGMVPAQALHFWMEGDAMGGFDPLLHFRDQGSDVGGAGSACVDNEIGMIRQQLKSKGIDDNTIIILMGDNGYFLGDRQLADKWLMYEQSIRVPMMIYDPRRPGHRVVEDEVLNIDIAPMIEELKCSTYA